MIRIMDYVDGCWSNDQGEVIFKIIDREFSQGNRAVVSFDGVKSISSSFINSAFVDLATCWGLSHVRNYLSIVDSTKNINEMVRYQVQTYVQSPSVRRFYLQDSEKYDTMYISQ